MPTEPTERYFDLEAANALVPRLNEIFEVVRGEIQAARAALRGLEGAGHPVDDTDRVCVDPDAPSNVQAMQRELLARSRSISERVEEVTELGAHVKAIDGLVDFPSRYGGRVVLLCWRFPEPVIAFWHDTETGFAGRQPVRDPDAFEGDYLQ
ncbi:MAG: DUF2203 family protein [Deltaproteobacteria bacterium]|nr:DUF2203 family protein [Deltaproteobacteria bacterium]